MTKYDYQFLTGTWEGPKGAAYNECFEFCRNHGWCVGVDLEGNPVLTSRGARAVKYYDPQEGRIDVC